MSERVRVVLAVEQTLPESVRVELDSSLEGAGWFSASEDYTCWVCRAKVYETADLERQVNKMMEFAAFNAGVEGRLSFALKVGEGSPKVCSTRVGSGGLKTRPVLPKSTGLNFATERVPNAGISQMPSSTNLPGVTQLKTAF